MFKDCERGMLPTQIVSAHIVHRVPHGAHYGISTNDLSRPLDSNPYFESFSKKSQLNPTIRSSTWRYWIELVFCGMTQLKNKFKTKGRIELFAATL